MKSVIIDKSRDKANEECGVFGIYKSNDNLDIANITLDALYGLQHRGQTSAGITVMKDGVPYSVKDLGIVSAVFNNKNLSTLPSGKIAVGHVRDSASEYLDRAATQPLVMRYREGSMVLANNGAISNFCDIRDDLEKNGAIFQSNSHAEIISYTISSEYITCNKIETAVLKAMEKLKGAYSLVLSSPNKLIGARDPHGFRPLCLGKIQDSYMIASESCAVETAGGEFIRDIEPGEMVVIDDAGLHSYKCSVKKKTSLCLFEFVYVSRPDSVIDNVIVHMARRKAGEILYKESPVKADIVCGVPDSGLDAAQGFSAASNIPYVTAFIKNKYIGRRFPGSSDKKKQRLMKTKLNVLKATVKDKVVVIIDDSIIRGSTSAHIVGLLKAAGAKEVHMRISSPQIVYPCYFGMRFPDRSEMISNKLSLNELAKEIGADSLAFLSVDGLHKTAEECNIGLCDGCFSGHYSADIPTRIFVDKFANKIKEV